MNGIERGRRGRGAPGILAAGLSLFLAISPCSPVHAETDLETRRDSSASAYRALLDEIALSESRVAEIAAEIAAVRKDNASLTAALVQAAKTEKKLAQDIEDSEARLVDLLDQERGLRDSLHARRSVLAEVLGALQRMGLNPPPAILVTPEDSLASVRSAILLGAVVPELRTETLVLVGDLKELAALMASISAERERLMATAREQVSEKQRLSLLMEEKQRLLETRQGTLAAERDRAANLAAKAGTLKELIESLEGEIEARRKAAEAARLAEEERLRRHEEAAARPVPEQNRLARSAPFSMLAGKLSPPAAGRFSKRFGNMDGLGGHAFGDTLQTQSGAIVTAPADGSVLYAGPFRSYGQLLILDAGDGYHVVLAGMDRISVSLGQAVISGEPVGSMGEARLASAAAFGGARSDPELYIEFRKDGKPVDPAPWWAGAKAWKDRK